MTEVLGEWLVLQKKHILFIAADAQYYMTYLPALDPQLQV